MNATVMKPGISLSMEGGRSCAGATKSSGSRERRLAFVLTLLFATLLSTSGRAQNVTASTFFGLPQAPLNGGEDGPQQAYRAPWLDNTEFRTETRDFDFARQQYLLRLSPSTPGKARAQAALYNLRENRPDFTATELACDVIKQRYEDWLDLYLLSTELQILNALDSVLADRNTVLSRQSASLDFDWNDLLDLRKEQTERQLRQLSLQERRRKILAANGIPDAALDFANFPEVMALLDDGPIAMPPEDPENAYELELAAREIELERAEGRQYLDFVQAQYQGPHDDLFAERFSIGVGFQLPGNGNRKLKIRELELEQAALLRKQALTRQAYLQQAEDRLEALKGLLRIYEETRMIFAQEAKEMSLISQNLTRREGFNPLPLLTIEGRKLKNQLRELGSVKEILEGYLKLKEDTLCTMPNGELWQREK